MKKIKQKKVYASPAIAPNMPVLFDAEKCNGCNKCVDACRMDVFLPNPIEGEPPIVMYPEECWFGGCCVDACPLKNAIRLEFPINMRMNWKRKEDGKIYRIGMKCPPSPNTKSPIG